jgi:transposase
MNSHKNARTTPFGRAVMVRRVLEDGWSVAAVAAAFEVSTRTVRKWLARCQAEGLPGLQDRPCRPKLVANKLAAPWIGMIVQLRRDYRMTAQEIGERLHLPRSTVAGHLARLGLGRLAQLEQSEPVRRYNRARPGELVHLDVKKLARFRRIGHRITGDRRQGSDGAGWEFVHVAVDDASRLAYVEVLADEGYVSRLFEGLPHPSPASHPHPPVHAQDQRQGRAVHPDAPARMGLCAAVPQLRHLRRRSAQVATPLQPRAAPC